MEEAGDSSGGGGGEVAAAPAGAPEGGSVLSGGDVGPATPAPSGGDPIAAAPEVSIPENWKDALPAEFKEEPSLAAIKDVASLAKSYLHSQKMIGQNKVALPDKHATPDDWKSFYQRLGQPDSLEGYELQVPEDADFEDGFISQLKEQFFNNNIMPNQANEILKWYAGANQQAIDAALERQEQARGQQLNELKQELGQAFEQSVHLAKAAKNHLAKSMGLKPDHVNSWLNETGVGDDPMMIKMLAKVGEILKEDKIIEGFGEQQAVSPKELQSKANAMLADPQHPVNVKTHPNHKAAIEELQSYFQQMHPEEVKGQSDLLT